MIKKLKHKSIQEALHMSTLIAGSIFIVAFLGIVMTGFSLARLYSNALQENAIKSNTTVISQINNNINYYIKAIVSISNYVQYEYRYQNGIAKDTIEDKINTIKESREDIKFIGLFDPDGTPIVITVPSESGFGAEAKAKLVKQDWFKNAASYPGEFYFSAPHYGFNDLLANVQLITFSSMISILDDETNQPKDAIIIIDLDYETVEQTISDSFRNYTDGYIYIINSYDKLISFPSSEKISKEEFSQNFDEVKEKVFGTFISDYDGVKKLTIIYPVRYTGWRLVGVIDLSASLKQSVVFRDTIIASLVVIIIYAIIISTHIASYLSSPIKQLESIMRHVQNGNFNIVVPITGSQETQSLSKSFEKMLFKIKSLMEDLKKTESIKRQRELDALQAKINPHFLYNTLESVVWLAEEGDNKGVVKQVTSLATLFRVSIAKGKDIITIQEELTHVKSYLEIQSIRYKDKFDYKFIVPEELKHCPTAKLIVQPIVENSIYHGLKYIEDDGHIIIKVEAVGDDKIAIKVIDNGAGMDEKTVNALLDPNGDIKRSGNGIGIININERLKLVYGNEYGLSVESELEEGTTVTILIPRLAPISPVTLRDNQMSL